MKNNQKFNYQIADEALILIGKFVADKRKKLGYTQSEIAEKVGTIQNHISNFEKGRQNLSIKTFIAILGVLDTHLEFSYKDPDKLTGYPGINKN